MASSCVPAGHNHCPQLDQIPRNRRFGSLSVGMRKSWKPCLDILRINGSGLQHQLRISAGKLVRGLDMERYVILENLGS